VKAGITKFKLTAHMMRMAVVTFPALAAGHVVRAAKNRRFVDELPDRHQVQSVLVLALDHLGDLILSSGYFRDIRNAFPGAKITLLVDQRFRSYANQCPDVDEVLDFNEVGTPLERAFVLPFRAFQFARRELWKRHFDIALNHRWDVDAVNGYLLGLFSLARIHAGYSNHSNPRKQVINSGSNGAFSHALRTTKLTHEAERGPALLRFLGLPHSSPEAELWPLPGDAEFARNKLANDINRPLIALGIGASQRRRQWPMDRYQAVAESLLESWPTAHFLVVGHRDDQIEAEDLRGALGQKLLNFAGQCTVTQSGALLAHCDLYVGSDSGPMHMAAAGGVPVVELSCHPLTGAEGSAHSPVRYHPLGVPQIVLQPADFAAPCHYECLSSTPHCLLDISVDQVTAAATDLLAKHSMDRTAPSLRRKSDRTMAQTA
jgi:lipopolysaccharide heptosyltransferase II